MAHTFRDKQKYSAMYCLGSHCPAVWVCVVQLAFDGIGSMPMARIENYRQVKQEAVDFEMKRRNARKNLDHVLIASPQDGKVMQTEGEQCKPCICGKMALRCSFCILASQQCIVVLLDHSSCPSAASALLTHCFICRYQWSS